MSPNIVEKTCLLHPGKGFEYCSGEILSFYQHDDCISGTFLTPFGKLAFKSNNTSLRDRLLIGFTLEFYNGFCYTNKSGSLTITEGKYGHSKLSLNLSEFKNSLNSSEFLYVCKIYGFYTISDVLFLKSRVLFPYVKNTLLIRFDESLFPFSSGDDFIGLLIKVRGTFNKSFFLPSKVTVLSKDHFFYFFDQLCNGQFEFLSYFLFLIEEFELILNKSIKKFHSLLFQTFSNVTKNHLFMLEQILYDKFYCSTSSFPLLLFEPPEFVDMYYCNMFDKCKLLLSNLNNPSIQLFLQLLKGGYPSYASYYLS